MSDRISVAEYHRLTGQPPKGSLPATPPPLPKAKGRVRQRETLGSDGLNKTERRYKLEILAPAMFDGEIVWFCAKPMKLRLGKNWKTSYEPDFLVMRKDGTLELVDIKAGTTMGEGDKRRHGPIIQEDAAVKVKAAARLYPIYTFVVAWKAPKWAGGHWCSKEY